MKSCLFLNNDLENNTQFKNDVKELLDLPASLVAQVPSFALEVLKTPTQREEDSVRKLIADKVAIPRARFDRVLNLSVFLLQMFAPKGEAESDLPRAVAEDVFEAFGGGKTSIEELAQLLEDLKKISQDKVQPLVLQKVYEQSVIPILGEISTCVDFRAIFDAPYRYEESVSRFQPRLMGTVPLGMIALRLSGRAEERVFFQLSRRTLQILIDELLALQRQMELAEKDLFPKEK